MKRLIGSLPGAKAVNAFLKGGDRRFRGYLDRIEGRTLYGWAFDPAKPGHRCNVDILVDGQPVATCVADAHRGDLLRAGIGDGSHAFSVALPAQVFDGKAHTLSARERQSGTLIPRRLEDVVLPEEFGADFAAEILGLRNGALVGTVYRPWNSAAPVTVALFLDDREVARTIANHGAGEVSSRTDLPSHCGFQLTLDKLDIAALVSGALKLVALPEMTVLAGVGDYVRGIVQFSVAEITESGFFVSLSAAGDLPSAAAFDLFLGQRPLQNVETVRHARQISLYAPLDGASLDTADPVSVRFAGTSVEVGGSPLQPVRRTERNVVANPAFETWSGSRPRDWSLDLPAGASAVPFYSSEIGRNGLPVGPTGIAFKAELDGSFLEGVVLAQSIDVHDLAGKALDIVVAGRSAPAGSLRVALSWHDPSGRMRSLEQLIVLRENFGLEIARMPLADDTIVETRAILSVQVASPAQKLEIALIAAGGSGFPIGTDDWATWHGKVTNAVRNGQFTSWPRPFRKRVDSTRQMIADEWWLEGARASPDLEARLTELVVRDIKSSNLGRLAYAAALRGKPGSEYVRFLTPLDKLQLSLAAPNVLSFYARPASSLEHRFVASERAAPTIAGIFVLGREMGDEDRPADSMLCALATGLKLPIHGEYVRIHLTSDTQALLRRSARAALQALEKSLLLVFEFHDDVDCAITDVKLGAVEESEFTAAVRTGYVGIEDANIVAQLDVLKGIDHWKSAEPLAVSRRRPRGGRRAEPTDAAKWSWPARSDRSVDVVICVHDAVEETLDCLDSLMRCTNLPHTVTLVDDGSNESTGEQLRAYVRGAPWMKIIELGTQVGYTRAANVGMTSSRTDWVVLLNSDTIVTPCWLEKMFEAVDTNPDVALVGPLSNAASWQSVPDVRDIAGKWSVNPLPSTSTIEEVAALVSELSPRRFPEVPLLNGFCTLMRRSALEHLGYLDDLNFPMGYGEETDLCIRARKAGYKLAVADHVYIYHVKSASFGSARRAALSKEGNIRLAEKHPDVKIPELERQMADLVSITELRRNLSEKLAVKDCGGAVAAA